MNPRHAIPVLLLAALAACASGKWREADARLESETAAARSAGYQPMSGPYNTFGAFTDSLATAWAVQLDSNTTYVIGVACTAACSGMSAAVAVPGAPPDSARTGASVLTVTTRAAGAYAVSVTARCAAGARCWWVGQVYQRGVAGRLVPGYDAGKVRRT